VEVVMGIDHIAMYVNDLEKARDFFVKYFEAESNAGYHNKKTNFKSYFLSFYEGSRLEIMNRPNLNNSKKELLQIGFIHLAFSVGSKERVDRITKQLKKDGYEVVSGPRTTGDGYYESCIIGVEGNQVEITI
jgi:lactoylglutathione lyase